MGWVGIWVGLGLGTENIWVLKLRFSFGSSNSAEKTNKKLVPNVSGGGVGVDYHYTNAHYGPNLRFLQQGRVWQLNVSILNKTDKNSKQEIKWD